MATESELRRDQAIRVRQAAMRADAFRSLLPLCEVSEAAQLIIERKLHDGSDLPRGVQR